MLQDIHESLSHLFIKINCISSSWFSHNELGNIPQIYDIIYVQCRETKKTHYLMKRSLLVKKIITFCLLDLHTNRKMNICTASRNYHQCFFP